MAFSTQKDFMKVDFLSDACRRSREGDSKTYRAAIKTYSSCTDSRAWSLSEENQTKYLQDMVACGVHFSGEGGGDRSEVNVTDHTSGVFRRSGKSVASTGSGRDASSGRRSGTKSRGGTSENGDEIENEEVWTGFVTGTAEPSGLQSGAPRPTWESTKDGSVKGGLTSASGSKVGSVSISRGPFSRESSRGSGKQSSAGTEVGNISSKSRTSGPKAVSDMSGDSLIEAACMKLDEINAIMKDNCTLRRQLEYSQEKLQSLNEENDRIKTIISESPAGSFSPLEDELNVLKTKGELTPEKVMKVFKNYIDDIKKHNQRANMIKTENDSLKIQIAKLEARVQIAVLPMQKETSMDINYLQTTVNDLRNEVRQLRDIEEDRARLQVELDSLKQTIKGMGGPENLTHAKEAAAELIEVKCDRDRLRNLISSMVGVEGEIRKMKEQACRTKQLEKELAELKTGMGDGSDAMSREEMQREIERLRKEKDEALSSTMQLTTLQEQLGDYDRMTCELHLYKIHYNEVINELRRVSTRVLQVEPELEETKRRLIVAETAISSYEKQMDELMDVIKELEEGKEYRFNIEEQGNNAEKLMDGHVKDLLSMAKIIIKLIQKETESRKNLENELKACKNELALVGESIIIDKDADKDRYTNSLNALQKELAACKKAKELCEEENRTLRGQVSNEDIEDLLDQLNACKRETERLQAIAEGGGATATKQFDEVFEELNQCRASLNACSDENKKFKDRISELESLVDACKNENNLLAVLEEKQISLDACQARLAELEQQIAKLTKELEVTLNTSSEQIEKLKNQLQEEKASIEKKIDDVSEKETLQQENQSMIIKNCEQEMQKLKDDFKLQMEKCQVDRDLMQKQMEELAAVKDGFVKTEDKISLKVSSFEKFLEECRKEKEALEKARNEAVLRLDELKAKHADEIDKLQAEFTKKVKDIETEKEKLADSLSKAKDQVASLHSTIDVRTQEGNEFNENCEKLKATLNDLTDRYNQLQSRYDSLQQHDDSIQKALNDLRKEYEDKSLEWAKELNEQKSLLEQAKVSLEAQRSEISRLNDVLKQASCKDLEDTLAKMKNENERLKQENTELKQTVDSKENQIASLKGKVNGVASDLNRVGKELNTADCSKYIEEIERLKNVISNHLAEIKDQANLLSSLREEVNAAKAARSEIEYELAKAKADKEALNEQLKAHVSKSLIAPSIKEDIHSDVKNVSEELNRCLAEKKRLQDENKQLQSEFQQLENLVKDIEDERQKNKQLESMMEECERKLSSLQSQPPLTTTQPTFNIENITDELKQQLQAETNKNNSIAADLESCKGVLNDLKEKLNQCQIELENCKMASAQKERNLEDCRKQLQDYMDKLGTVTALLESSKRDLMNKEEAEKKLLLELENSKAQLEQARNQISALQQQSNLLPDEKPDPRGDQGGEVGPGQSFKASEPSIKPSQPSIKPSEPSIKPSEPNIKPSEPSIKPSEPSIYPSGPSIRPSEPTIKPADVSVKLPQSTPTSSGAALKPSEPTLKPSDVPASMVTETEAGLAQETSKIPSSIPKGTIDNTDGDRTAGKAVSAETISTTKTTETLKSERPKEQDFSQTEAPVDEKPADMFASTINEIKSSHCENLEKMQKMYEEQMQEMMKNHSREIQSLRMTNEALQQMLEDIKSQIAALGPSTTTSAKEDIELDICGGDKKLSKICLKIIKTSINCLSIKELKYLHCAVYRAGVKMMPLSTKDPTEIEKCCECTGFICCLPSIPKDAEKKFIERINCLENELENANELLQRLRERYENKSSCIQRCYPGHSARKSTPARGINDAVNQILKCAREGRRNSGC